MKRITLFSMLVLMSALFAAAQTLPEPRKGDTVGWHEVRPGETLSGITGRYLGDMSLWRENHRLNPDVADPDRLTPGQRIRVILAREIAARRADVEQVSRRVERKPWADQWTNAQAGDQLVEREGLRTYPKSSAALGFDDGSNLVLTENSIVFLREYSSSLRRVDRSLIEVVDGGIDVAVTPKAADRRGRDIEIVMGDVKARPRAVQRETAKARAVKDGTTDSAKLMVYAGASDIESAGVRVAVAKGQGTIVKKGEAPAPPERLLAAPKPASPARGATIGDVLDASWAPVPKAASYTLEVCRDEACGSLVDRLSGLTSTSARTGTLPPGALFWRVTARSASGLDGYPSSAIELSVARRVAGRVLVDREGANDPAAWTGAGGARVRLHRDDGDGLPGAGDTLVEEVRTDATGRFTFLSATTGASWLAVDSLGASPAGTWLEQVAGPAGSLCADGAGGVATLAAAGPCYGGRRAGVSDAFDSLATSEHVARLVLSDYVPLGVLDVVFSPSVVTTTADADVPAQGSLRQFMANAATIPGEDAMRFVPMEPPGGDGRWWTITLTSALPPVDDVVAIDGRAWSPAGELRDANEGSVSDATVVGAAATDLAPVDRPELEIFAAGASRPLYVSSGVLRVRHVAVYGAEDADLTSAGLLEVENALVGIGAGMAAPATAAVLSIDVSGRGTAEVSRALIRAGSSYGVLVRSETSEAHITAEDVQILNCAAGAGVRIESNGSRFTRTHVSPCGDGPAGVAFELKGIRAAENHTCRDNRIASSTIVRHGVGVLLRVGAMDNAFESNLFQETEKGIRLELIMGFLVPKGNRITRNEWRGVETPFALSGTENVKGILFFAGADSCAGSGWAVDRALDFPGSVSVSRMGGAIDLSASICPGMLIEAYHVTKGGLTYLGEIRADASGSVAGQIAAPPGATRIGLLATDNWNTTSRLSLHRVD